MYVGRVCTCPCFFFGNALLRRTEGEAHTDTGWRTMSLVDSKHWGFKIISEKWSAHHRDSQK